VPNNSLIQRQHGRERVTWLSTPGRARRSAPFDYRGSPSLVASARAARTSKSRASRSILALVSGLNVSVSSAVLRNVSARLRQYGPSWMIQAFTTGGSM
jgi:hypothetical protein